MCYFVAFINSLNKNFPIAFFYNRLFYYVHYNAYVNTPNGYLG